jgi:hypothetical protein
VERRIRRQAGRLAAARVDADVARVAVRNVRSELERLEASVSSLADESRSAPRWVYAGWVVAGVLVGALALVVLRRRRSRPSRSAQVAGWLPSDEELRELLSSRPAQRG